METQPAKVDSGHGKASAPVVGTSLPLVKPGQGVAAYVHEHGGRLYV